MRAIARWSIIAVGLVGLVVLIGSAQTKREVAKAQTRKPFFITRWYTGPDGQTHAEEIEPKFTAGSSSPVLAWRGALPAGDVFKLMGVTGAELHRSPPGAVRDWHTAGRRQYLIYLSGRGELEIAGGKKIPLEPGDIMLEEDTTGKGHKERTIGTEDRVFLQLPLADQSGR